MQRALLLLLGAAAGAVENALHDSRAALGDAKPCCGHCKRWLYPCPPSMHKGASPTLVSWEDFTAPLPPGAEVEIPCGTRVEVRTDLKAKIGGLRVRGELAFMDGADVELETPHVYVCGLLAAGTVKKPYESSLRITLAAGDEAVALDEDGIDYGTEAFAVFGGLVFLRGAACPDPRVYASRDAVARGLVPRTTWTRLKRPALPGDAKVRVAGVDATEVARVGARVAIASTDWDDALTETRTVVASRRTTGLGVELTLDAPLTFAHGGTAPVAAEVASLSRNIRIIGASGCARRAPKPRCGHVIISHTPHGVVCGVELSNLGAHTTLGKYPLHAHMCGNASSLAFTANAIHETHHRSLVVHSTSDALFAHNVAYDGTGHMYVLENGLELRNSIVGNVGMVTWPPEPAWSCPGHRCAGDGGCSFGVGADIEACGSRDDDHAEVFWLANPENDVIGNVAVGGYRSGFSIYPVLAGPLVNDWAAQRAAGLDRRQVAWLRVAGADPISRRAVAAAKLFVSDRHGSFRLNASDGSALRSHSGSVVLRPHVRYHGTRALHLEYAHPGRFDGNVAHSTRIGFHVYPEWSPGSLKGGARRTANWTNLVAYKIAGAAVRAKTRCASHDCLTVDRLRVYAVSMVARARDLHARYALSRAEYFGPESIDAAAAAGACYGRDGAKKGCPGVTSVAYATARRGQAAAQCERCGSLVVSRAPSEGSSSGAGRRARRCDAPHWFVNFDRASIVADLAEKCRLNNKKDAKGSAIEDLKSCYLARGGSLSASIRVDAASAASFERYRASHAGGACSHENLSKGSFEVASREGSPRRASGLLELDTEAAACPPEPYCDAEPRKWVSKLQLRDQGEAGLRDRASSLARAADLAATLCAKLDHGAPFDLLAPRHNGGARVSAAATWDRFVNVTWARTGAPVVLEAPVRADATVDIRSETAEAVARDYATALERARRGKKTLWVIEVKYHTFKNGLRLARNQSCVRTRARPPVAAEEAADRVIDSLGLATTPFDAIHVRRGDEAGDKLPKTMRLKGQSPCDTVPAAVAAAAACRSRSAPVVLFSDERDAAYRQALRDALATGGRRVVLGDEAVRAAVGDADNYFVFAVAAAVLVRGSHVLDIRRGHCPGPCVNP